MFFINAQFNIIILRGLINFELTNCIFSILNFGQICKYKNGITPITKIELNSTNMHIYTVCPS